MCEQARPVIRLGGGQERTDQTPVVVQRTRSLHIVMRCGTTSDYLMGVFSSTLNDISLTETTILESPLPSDGGKLLSGRYGLSENYPGCAACGAASYMQCLECLTVSCLNGSATTGWCVNCNMQVFVEGSISTLRVSDAG